MRFTNLLAAVHAPGGGRNSQPPNKVPFQEIMTLKLKDRVSGKGDRNKDPGCLYEMNLLIACLKRNEFENKLCGKEVEGFQLCYKTYMENRACTKEAQRKGSLVPGEKTLSHVQVKKLLKMRPIV